MRSRVQSHRLLAFQRQHGCCCYCGVPMWLHAAAELPAAAGSPGGAHELRCTAEHLVPRSNGGTDRLENIAAACARCNHTRHRRKRPPPPLEYQRQVARRVAAGRWHQKWVFEAGLLSAGSHQKP